MAVRFVIGRAGTGKTYHCLEAVRSRLRKNPIDGPRLVLLVPEQASLQTERAILRSPDIPGAHRAEVLSFQRLALRVLDSAGVPTRRALSEPARTMVLRYLVRERSGQLRYYRRLDRLGGFIERLSATITEFIQEAVEPDDLAGTAQQTGGDDPAQCAKLHDLHLIYCAYIDYLGSERIDPSQHLQLAREHLHQCEWLTGAELWVDGFASLSGQEMLTLTTLAGRCSHVEITALIDPSLCTPLLNRSSEEGADRLFRRTLQTYENLRRSCAEAGLAVEDPLMLQPGRPQRFQECESLAELERSLFAVSEAASPTRGGATCSGDAPVDGVELVELPSRRVEVDYAVSRVCQWVQGARTEFRYRDIAIIVRDLEPYHDLLSEAMAARDIPTFVDRRRPTAHHPLVELLRAATTVAAQRLSLNSVRLALKTGLLPIACEAADELENYLIAHGIFGVDLWERGDWSFVSRSSFTADKEEPSKPQLEELARINVTRRAFLDLIGEWLEFASYPDGHAGPAWADAITTWLIQLQIGQTLQRWADVAEADGDVDQAAEHRQVWIDVLSFLEDLSSAFSDLTLSIDELADVLDQGLSKLTLGLAPPMVDQVLVGSIERSRHPDIKAAVVLGFNDGIFPMQLTEDAILNDDDRTLLNESGVRVAPALRDRVLDEAMLIYIAVTRPSNALVVTYASSDNQGKVLRPSPYLDALREACPGLRSTTVGEPARLRRTWDILTSRDLTKRLVTEFRTRPRIAQDNQDLRSRWNELYEAVRLNLAEDPVLRRAMTSLAGLSDARMSRASAKRLIPAPLRTSVSRLETYAACPFQYFARYALRLRERAEAELAPVDVGQVHHAILEDFVRILADRREGFAKLGDGELLEQLHDSCGRVATRLPTDGVVSDARNAYILRRSAAYLARVIRAQQRVSRFGTARPRAAELPFGFDQPAGLPAMELTTKAGRRVLLRGLIDRVDLAELGDELLGIVVDYKRTRDKHLKLDEVYHGLSLQLLAYLLVLAKHGTTLAGRPIRPIAALYVSLAPTYCKVDHPESATSRALGQGGTYRPRGVLLTDSVDALDQSDAAGWSEAYSLYRKKNGDPGHIDESDAAGADPFESLLDHTQGKLSELADGIIDGNIAVSPYRLGTFSPCSWCAMSSVCRFEMGISDVRFLERLKRSEVFRRLGGTGS